MLPRRRWTSAAARPPRRGRSLLPGAAKFCLGHPGDALGTVSTVTIRKRLEDKGVSTMSGMRKCDGLDPRTSTGKNESASGRKGQISQHSLASIEDWLPHLFATPSLTAHGNRLAHSFIAQNTCQDKQTFVTCLRQRVSSCFQLTFCISPFFGSLTWQNWKLLHPQPSALRRPWLPISAGHRALKATGVHLGFRGDQLLDHTAMAFPSCSI